MFYTYKTYMELPKALTPEQMNQLHVHMTDEIGTDPDAMELYEDLLAAANRYAAIRAKWLLQDREGRMEADAGRTGAHDTVIRCLDVLSRYLKSIGKEAAWRDALGYEADDRNNRKAMGDFACYLAFVGALNMR